MVAGEIVDVVAEKTSSAGGARALYDLTDAVRAVCKQQKSASAVDAEIKKWSAGGHWSQRCPKPIREWTHELPRVGTGPKQRAIDLYGVEELVRHFDPENVDSFRKNHEFVERAEAAAGSKRACTDGAAQRCELAIPCPRSSPVSFFTCS